MIAIVRKISLKDFKPWASAAEKFEKIKDMDLFDEVEDYIKDTYLYDDDKPISEAELNDIIRFDDEINYMIYGE